MAFELCKHGASAHQTRQPTVKQFLVMLMVTIVLVTPLVTRCAGGVANATSSSPTTSTSLKTPKVSPTQTLATAPVHSVARLNGGSFSLPSLDNANWGNALVAVGLIIAALIGGGGTITGACIGCGAALTAALLYEIPATFISGGFGIIAALIGSTPGMLGVLIALK